MHLQQDQVRRGTRGSLGKTMEATPRQLDTDLLKAPQLLGLQKKFVMRPSKLSRNRAKGRPAKHAKHAKEAPNRAADSEPTGWRLGQIAALVSPTHRP